ncbi:MAG: hypothetical protein H7Z13_10810 [Ferruginibacter sp.]|nr:hypothetical protein [Ferruginibacter sp.]
MIAVNTYPFEYLINESQSLISRLQQLKPFSMTMPMVKGASVSAGALDAVITLLENGKLEIHRSISQFIEKVKMARQQGNSAGQLQTAFTIQKLRYNSILDQLDIFADVLSQRSEHEVGIWLSGLDVLAEDGLAVCKNYFDIPPMMVFLERGHGAAIRRARTRLPGGDENPVAVIQIPRERMVGSGIAASLIHEVGHQAAESLDLTNEIRALLSKKQTPGIKNKDAWKHYERWISEILADYWAMGHLGISATLGLMGVVTLPKYFQFRLDLDDPHPAPYVRVKLSCAFGKALYPHSQWNRIWQLWQLFYPTDDLPEEKIALLKALDEEEENFVQLVLRHKPHSLKGKQTVDILPFLKRQPAQLQRFFQQWKLDTSLIESAPPTLVFAVLGQAKFDQAINAGEENSLLTQQLRNWAYNRK